MKGIGNIAGAVLVFFIVYLIFNHIDSANTPPSSEITYSTQQPSSSVTLPQTTEPEPISTTSIEVSPPMVELSEVIIEEIPSTEYITRNYSWLYQGEWSWEMEIPESLYNYYQQLPRTPTNNYSVYVTHPLDDPHIDKLVNSIEKVALEQEFSEYQTIEYVIAFVQSLPYTVDSVTASYDEYPRYPIETLVDNGGDCEDTSILLASMIDKLGYGIVLIHFPHHCAVGVKGGEGIYGSYYEYKGSKYYYIETTGEGWGLGELPDEYKGTSAKIEPLIPVPILTHDWVLDGKGYYVTIEVNVKNLGTASANNVSVLAGFDAGNDMVWNSQRSEAFSIGTNQQIKVTLNLRVPLEKHTRLLVQLVVDDLAVEESYSKWFDT